MIGLSGNRLYDDETASMLRPRPVPVGSASVAIAPPVAPLASGPVSPTLQQEVTFISGVDADGTIAAPSYWSGYAHITAFKFGAATAGTGATISYAFDAGSGFTTTEQTTFRAALAMWQSVADVHFVAAASPSQANILLHRGSDEGAFTTLPVTTGSGAALGQYYAQAVISIDTSVDGFDLSGSFDRVGGYGVAAVTHEIGHALGLGHAGYYNDIVDPATQQFSAYDDALYTTMSYLSFADRGSKYAGSYAVTGTDWGYSSDGYLRTAPHTVQQLDILAIQRLYGTARDTVLSGGQVYGFNANITGPLHDVFDFDINTHPIVTLYNQGTNNTLDLRFSDTADQINLNAGTFSSFGGLQNNIGIAFGTQINTVISGNYADVIIGNDNGDTLSGSGGTDRITGGRGNDLIDGGLDADTMIGGAGDDSYVVDAFADRVTELPGGGYDTVSAIGDTYILDPEVEALTYTAIGNFNGFGNAGDNRLTGGAGNDLLNGLAGNDVLIGGASMDRLDGGTGADTMSGGIGDDTYIVDSTGDVVVEAGGGGFDLVITALDRYDLPVGVDAVTFTNRDGVTGNGNAGANRFTGSSGSDVLNGLRGDDILVGANGDDRLDGGIGRDLMTGGNGDDSYVIDDRRDVASEDGGAGIDGVIATIGYTLGADFENLTLSGGARKGVGNAIGNTITGGAKADVLGGLAGDDAITGGGGTDRIDGGTGDDRLIGGLGRDTLTGGTGADLFVFAAGETGAVAKSADRIVDFTHIEHDKIDLLAIDAVERTRVHDVFDFIGKAEFSGAAGELRYQTLRGDTLIMGDRDGDGVADLIIRLTGTVALVASDFARAQTAAFAGAEAMAAIEPHGFGGGGVHAPTLPHEVFV